MARKAPSPPYCSRGKFSIHVAVREQFGGEGWGEGARSETNEKSRIDEEGWDVIRFSNEDVLENAEAVAIVIAKHLGLEPESPSPNAVKHFESSITEYPVAFAV